MTRTIRKGALPFVFAAAALLFEDEIDVLFHGFLNTSLDGWVFFQVPAKLPACP